MINLLLFFLAAQWVPSSLSSASFGQVIPGKIQSPGACRTKSGSSGDKYIDYDVMKAKSQYQCATACSENDKCNGWEWSESSGACEIWWNYAPEYEALDGYSCFMKDTYSSMRFSGYPVSAGRVLGGLFDGYSGHVDAACRTSSGENGDRGDEYDREDDFDDKYECANECTKKSNCRGFEWNDDNKRCELWWEYAPRYESKDDFYCFMKDESGCGREPKYPEIKCGEKKRGSSKESSHEMKFSACGTESEKNGSKLMTYIFNGNGKQVTIGPCDKWTDFNTRIQVYKVRSYGGYNGNMQCIVGENDSVVSFNSEDGAKYVVHVYGSKWDENGNFMIKVFCDRNDDIEVQYTVDSKITLLGFFDGEATSSQESLLEDVYEEYFQDNYDARYPRNEVVVDEVDIRDQKFRSIGRLLSQLQTQRLRQLPVKQLRNVSSNFEGRALQDARNQLTVRSSSRYRLPPPQNGIQPAENALNQRRRQLLLTRNLQWLDEDILDRFQETGNSYLNQISQVTSEVVKTNQAIFCDKDDDYYYNNYEGYSGAVCRTSNYMTGSNGNEYDVEYNVDMHECMDMCSKSRNCNGWEWSRSRKQCELWKEYAPKHVKAEDNYCFMKQRTDRD
mmetsp:Transcript_27279/g.33036  ORF Transcript_27279/g.33036 Transcript_27279/m.33036 type:complete len:617 (-) Transcript_27279:229-2079(-)